MAKRHNPSKVSQRPGEDARLGFRGRPNIFVEAVGSEAWGTQLPYLRAAARNLIGSDSNPLAFGLYQVDRGHLLPECPVDDYVSRAIEICRANRVNVVIPCLGPALQGWARHREMLAAEGIHVLISPPATVAMCCDKWETYRFFLANGIPTPRTSLRHAFELIKLRAGEGSTGVLRVRPEESMQIDMTGCISQEFLNGDEYSIDVLCDLRGDPIYIVPRQRHLFQRVQVPAVPWAWVDEHDDWGRTRWLSAHPGLAQAAGHAVGIARRKVKTRGMEGVDPVDNCKARYIKCMFCVRLPTIWGWSPQRSAGTGCALPQRS